MLSKNKISTRIPIAMILSYWLTEKDKFVKKLHHLYHDTISKVWLRSHERGCSRCSASGPITV